MNTYKLYHVSNWIKVTNKKPQDGLGLKFTRKLD